jgi:hypothetical protein
VSTQTLPQPHVADTDDTWDHLFCRCYPDVALCGLDVSGWTEDGSLVEAYVCPLCVAVMDTSAGVCPRCGK